MSNSIESSQESGRNSAETDIAEPLKQDAAAENCDSDSSSSIEYTYHRHSAPKNVTYYRCSDKRCPARVHYNLETKTFTMKNKHLNSKIHKRPCAQKIVSSDELINCPNLLMRGPLVISKRHFPEEPKGPKEMDLPEKRQRFDTLLDGAEENVHMLQLKVDHPGNFAQFSNEIIEKCLASKVYCYTSSKKFSNQICEKRSENVIEVYTTSQFIGKVLLQINNYFGRGVEVLFCQKE